MKNGIKHTLVNSISELHKMMGLPKPLHPLVSLINMGDTSRSKQTEPVNFIFNFYGISLKKNVNGKLKYGQNYYDFDEGVLAMTAPKQVLSISNADNYEVTGWWLVFHPDFIRNYSLAKTINSYGYFSYAVNEALHLSDREEQML